MKYQIEFLVPERVFPGQYGAKAEDGGASVIVESVEERVGTDDDGFFIRLHSHNGAALPFEDRHPTIAKMLGRRVRVTVEVLE